MSRFVRVGVERDGLRKEGCHDVVARNGVFAVPATCAHAADSSGERIFSVVHSFKRKPDGLDPLAVMTVCDGKFLGTTVGGGKNYGTVFSFDPETGVEAVVHAFSGGADGGDAYGGLACIGSVVYGTTEAGGGSVDGVVFGVDAKTGKDTTLHSFTGEPDGEDPTGTLLQVDGVLYGTTGSGGSANFGTIFSLDPSTGAYHVLYSFKELPDAQYPVAGLTYENGVLYGTSAYGGNTNNGGAIFKFGLATGAETVLYNFSNGSDGGGPYAALLAEGNLLFGTTTGGGALGYGTVFKVGARSGIETVLHSFSGGKDGENPFTAPLIGVAGLLYGSTSDTVFQIDPKTGAEKPLHRNLAQPNGLTPRQGVLYGTTYEGGKTANGTIFRLTP